MFVKVGPIIIAAALALISLLTKHYGDKTAPFYRYAFFGSVCLIALAPMLSVYSAVKDRRSTKSRDDREVSIQLTQVDMRSTLDQIAEAVGVSDPTKLVDAVKAHEAQLATIQSTLDGIVSTVGARDHTEVLTAVKGLKQSAETTRLALDSANNQIRDLQSKTRVLDAKAEKAATGMIDQYYFDGRHRHTEPGQNILDDGVKPTFAVLIKLQTDHAWGDLEQAAAKSLAATPEWLTPHLLLAVAKLNLGKQAEAVATLDLLLERAQGRR